MSVDTDAATEKWRGGSSQTTPVSRETFDTDTGTPSITTTGDGVGTSKLVSVGLETGGLNGESGATSRPLRRMLTEEELDKMTLNEKLSSGLDTEASKAEDLFAQPNSKDNCFCCARFVQDHYKRRGRAGAKREMKATYDVTSGQNMIPFSNPVVVSTDSEQLDSVPEDSSALVTK